ncbi:MAG: class II fructose-bisphosphate aldolase [Lentisphaerae bacterium]|nr:class II fructose-bisphosphate aldolase [Lentisphaerota bacterium]
MSADLLSSRDLVLAAWRARTVVPGFNIPYLPMMEPVVRALRDTGSFGFIMVARLEWEKFQAGSLAAIRKEYGRVGDPRHTRLHLDHVPAIDEDQKVVDFEGVIREAIALGYESVMVDGSRLPLEGNMAASKAIADMAHAAGLPAEAELGAVMGHEAGPMPSYEELFASGRGFTDPEEAARFVKATGIDWLSVAIGNVHGAISAARNLKKVEARLHIERLAAISRAAGIPLVLHGGTGIARDCILDAIRNGIAKINIATAIRQPYEAAAGRSVAEAQQAVYDTMIGILRSELELEGLAATLGVKPQGVTP